MAPQGTRRRRGRLRAGILIGIVTVGLGIGTIASPWPLVAMLRVAFAADAYVRGVRLERHVPPGVIADRDLPYADRPGATLDLFLPPASAPDRRLPVILWVHGGGFVAGNKRDVVPYLRLLAGRGFATVAVGYPIAPGAQHPDPVASANAAIAFLQREAARFGLDMQRLVIAGDSAGAHIAAELALVTTDPAMATATGIVPALAPERLRGVVLFCLFDPAPLPKDGWLGWALRQIETAYFGQGPGAEAGPLEARIGPRFPPAFISVGNGDPLAPVSRSLAAAIAGRGGTVDTLFFPDDHQPTLPHEFQFDLDGEAGRLAFSRLVAFLERVTR